MSETLYKGVRPDGRDFYSGTVQWAPEKTKARKGRVVKHPTSTTGELGDFTTFLSVSTDPTNLPGSQWPLRLLEVEPVGDVLYVDACKRGGVAFRVVREVDPSLHFGPMGEHVVRLIERVSTLTCGEACSLGATGYATWDATWSAARDAACAARYAAWYAAGYAARAAARYAARYAARDAAWDAAASLAVRDLIGSHGFTQEHYDALTGPWRKVIGPIHPDDEDLR